MLGPNDLERALGAVGDVLTEAGETARVLVVGGAALILRGDIQRLTVDVDVLAEVEDALMNPDPFSPALAQAVEEVAEVLGLESNWMNGSASEFWKDQWPDGLPDALLEGVEWRTYGGLDVGLASRQTLIAMKMKAVATKARYEMRERVGADVSLEASGAWIPDTPDAERHLNDLLALAPSDPELDRAGPWVERNANSPDFSFAIQEVLRRVRAARR